jgi:phytoene dehydrogenase-like protein
LARLRGVTFDGPGTVAAAFARAAGAAGAEVRLGAEVEEIRIEDGAARGVQVAGRRIEARAVVSSVAPSVTLGLAGRPALGHAGPGAAKLHLALAGEPDLSCSGGRQARSGSSTS